MSVNAFEQPMDVLALESLSGTLAVVQVAQTRPPGARVSVRIARESEDIVLHGKVVGQARIAADRLRMSLRINNLSKRERELLQTYLHTDEPVV